MPPEEADLVVAIDFRLENGKLVGRAQRLQHPANADLYVSFYSRVQPKGFTPACGGAIYVQDSAFNQLELDDVVPRDIGPDQYLWRDATGDCRNVFLVIVLPAGYTLSDPEPLPQEVKVANGRLAACWRPASDGRHYEVSWAIHAIDTKVLEAEAQRINKYIFSARRGASRPEFDVALSYASEDSEYVQQVAAALKNEGISIYNYRDQEAATQSWGQNLEQHLEEVYSKKARYSVVFISRHYAEKRWTTFELQMAQANAYIKHRAYILPARFDDTELPGLLPEVRYESLKNLSPQELAERIRKMVEKVRI
jgi:hypothetical protein